MKLCKDCKYFRVTKDWGIDFYTCIHTKNITTNLVTGETIYKYEPSALRIGDTGFNSCGSSGQWFEPKEVEENGPDKA